MLDSLPFGLAHHMALFPLAGLTILLLLGRRRDPAYWWLAGAFGVSWLADSAAHYVAPWLVSSTYPVLQSGLAVSVLLVPAQAAGVVLTLVLAGIATLLAVGIDRPEILLHTMAWLTVVGVAWERVTPFRGPLLVYFGLGTCLWWWYAGWPGWPSWLAYQASRLVGLAAFSWQLWRGPRLALT